MSAGESTVWTVLRHHAFRILWIAGLISLIGSWMQNMAAAWLMTELSREPMMVGLVQAAQMLPGICIGVFTGALIDTFDRRRFLVAVVGWQTGVTLVLAILTYTHLITPWLLIACIFAVGAGNACQTPAMSANLQEIVPREDVVSAVTLNSMALNLSRALGPALAGILVSITGEGTAFLLNSASFAVYVVAVARHVPSVSVRGAQGILESIAGGIRYARKAKRFQAVLIRGFSYFFCASAAMALLPVVAREELKVGPEGFGSFLFFIGVGAVTTGFGLIGHINRRFPRDQISLTASLIVACGLMGIGWVREYWLFAAILVMFGGAWMTSMISLQIAAQMVLPPWVRGRGLSLGMMSFSGGMALGSITWGAVADRVSLSATYTTASIGLAALTLLTYRFKIGGNEPEEV